MRTETTGRHRRSLAEQTAEQLRLKGSARDLLIDYLDLKQPERPELLEEMERQTASVQIITSPWDIARSWVQWEPAFCQRLLKAIWALEGQDLAYFLFSGAQNDWEAALCRGSTLEELIGPAARMAVLACALSNRTLWWLALRLGLSGIDNPELLAQAQSLWKRRSAKGSAVLAALYLRCAPQGPDAAEMERIFSARLADDLYSAVRNVCTLEQLSEVKRYFAGNDFTRPVPEQAASAFLQAQGGSFVAEHFMSRLSGSFLLLGRLPAADRFLELCLKSAPNEVLRECLGFVRAEDVRAALPWLAERVPVGELFTQSLAGWDSAWGLFLSNEEAQALLHGLVRLLEQRQGKAVRAAMKELVGEADAGKLGFFRQLLPELTEEALHGAEDVMRSGAVDALVSAFPGPADQQLVRAFLSGETDALPRAIPHSDNFWYYSDKVDAYAASHDDVFTARCAAVCLCGGMTALLLRVWGRGEDKAERMEKILELTERAGMPAAQGMEALTTVSEALYREEDRSACMAGAVRYLIARRGALAAELPRMAQEGSVLTRCAAIRAMGAFPDEYQEEIFACAGDSSKQVREILLSLFAEHPEWADGVRRLLGSKKAADREMALEILRRWGPKPFAGELSAMLEREKSQKLAALCRDLLGLQEEEAAAPVGEQDPVKAALKGGKARKVQWLFDTPFLPVRRTDGNQAEDELLQALLVSCMDGWQENPSQSCAPFADRLNRTDLASFACEVLDRWLEQGAQSKQKWVLTFAALFGGSEAVARLKHQISEWPQNARGAIACDAVYALALSPEPEALLTVDSISRKFKFRQVKTAAGLALGEAARKLGLSPEELADRIVPDLGFGEDLSRVFSYGPRSFTVTLSPALELEVTDGSGKRLKNMPAPGKNDDPEKANEAFAAFKSLKKQLKATAAAQKLRLEQALSVNRQWSAADWEKLFVRNPVMHQFAISLIWGVYEDGALRDTFRYMEDGSFNTRDEEEYVLPQEGHIGLVHPIELSQEELEDWRQQLEDYEVEQSIEQLSRPVFRLTEEERGLRSLERFGGRMLSGLSLMGKLTTLGWYRGSVQDAGCFYEFYREDGDVGVNLSFSGCYVGDQSETVTVYDAVFYRAGTVQRGSYVYDKPEGDAVLPLADVDPRYFSEIVYQLQKAIAASGECNENWREDR